MIYLVIYLLVGLGWYLGRREAGDGAVRAVALAVVWPVVIAVGLGRSFAA